VISSAGSISLVPYKGFPLSEAGCWKG